MEKNQTQVDTSEALEGITKGMRTQEQKSQKLLKGMLNRDERAINYNRAITALDTGDPMGLEALDFGSVRGKPAVSFVNDKGERRVLSTTMPTYLAALKSRTQMRQVMREKVKGDIERGIATEQLAPRFNSALDNIRAETGDLFVGVAIESFKVNPTETAAMISDLQRKLRTNREQGLKDAAAFVAGRNIEKASGLSSMWGSHLRNKATDMKNKTRPGTPAEFAQVQSEGERIQRIQMLVKDTPENQTMSFSERLNANHSFAQTVLTDVFSLLEEGVSMPGGGNIRLNRLDLSDPMSISTYLSTFERFLFSNGMVSAPLNEMDKALILRQAMHRQGTMNPEAVAAAVELMSQQAAKPVGIQVPERTAPEADRSLPPTSASAPTETPEQRLARLRELAAQAAKEAGGGQQEIFEKARTDPEFAAKYAEILKG